MTDRNPISEEERAVSTVAACERQLRRGQENARSASEVLRRATRHLEEAEYALGDATRRLGRVRSSMARANGDDTDRLALGAESPSVWATGEVLEAAESAIDLSRKGALEVFEKMKAIRERGAVVPS